MSVLVGEMAQLRPATDADLADLALIRGTPEVSRRWGGDPDPMTAVTAELHDPDVRAYVVELGGRIVGWIQWQAEEEPDYRHASIDVYIDPALHGRGIGADAVRTLARHLFAVHGHHRVTIDPAVDNEAAIRAYTRVGFRPVGVMRRYERGADGTWHDNLLMDLLADEVIDGSAG